MISKTVLGLALLATCASAMGLRAPLDISVPRKLSTMEQLAEMTGSDPYGCLIEQNFDYVGNDLTNVPGAVGDCCAKCRNTLGCVAYTWTNHNGGTCWLKYDVSNIVVNTNAKSAIMQFYYQEACTAPENGVDYVGNDIGSVHAPSADECCQKCRDYTGCRAYTHSSYLGGTCWLKSKKGNTIANANVKSGLAYPTFNPSCQNIQPNVDYVGGDIANVPGARPEVCCQQCRIRTDCRYFSWSNHNGGTCWLKKQKGVVRNSPGVYSAAVRTPTCTSESPNIDYVNNDIGNKPSASAAGCCQLCADFPGCKAYTWSNHNGGTCWLKSAKGATVTTTGTQSGTLQ